MERFITWCSRHPFQFYVASIMAFVLVLLTFPLIQGVTE
jgi:hypothetical protein